MAIPTSTSSSNQNSILIDALKENGGRLGNVNARRILSEKLQSEIGEDDYELLKVRLISLGIIRKAPGRGGSIELLPELPDALGSLPEIPATEKKADNGERTDTLFASLGAIPGVRLKRNKSTITVFCGEDSDKLYCGWARKKSIYFIKYVCEPGKKDCHEIAAAIFQQATSDVPYAAIERSPSFPNTTNLFLCDNVAQVNRVMRRLWAYLEDISLHNGPAVAEPPGEPRSDTYFLEIATLIKFCVENNFTWPLKNWRKTLGFDDVDAFTVIGRSVLSHLATSTRREHVIPVSLIREEAKSLAEKGAPASVIAEFLRCNLYVAIISEDEARLLDCSPSNGGISLKNCMPEGWVFGGDPLERLKSAGIPIQIDSQGPAISRWKGWKGPRLRDKIRDVLNSPIIKF
jgi:hypothetical protein